VLESSKNLVGLLFRPKESQREKKPPEAKVGLERCEHIFGPAALHTFYKETSLLA